MIAALSSMPDFVLTVITFFVVIAVKWQLMKVSPHYPLSFFRFYCQKLAEKVNKSQNSETQQRLSGHLSFWVTLLPIVVILWLFETLIGYPFIWHGLLLYAAIDGFELFIDATKLHKALDHHNKSLARVILAGHCLRDTAPLSELGISKAWIEVQWLKICQLWLTPAMLFLFVHPLTAFAYRLMIEMHYAWNKKQPNFEHFGGAASFWVQVINWLPARVLGLLVRLQTIGNSAQAPANSKGLFFKEGSQYLLSTIAYACNVKVAGVAMYKGVKRRSTSYNAEAPQPDIDIILLTNKSIKGTLLLAMFLLLALAVCYLVVAKQLPA